MLKPVLVVRDMIGKRIKNKMEITKEDKKNLGKHTGTRVIGTGKLSFSIKIFENGAIIRKKKENYLLEEWQCGDLALSFRKKAYPKCFTEVEVKNILEDFRERIGEVLKQYPRMDNFSDCGKLISADSVIREEIANLPLLA